MKYYIITFLIVLCITTIFAGSRNAKTYRGVGVTDCKIDESGWIPAQKGDGMVGEMILVDMDRPYQGYAIVKDVKT